MERSVEIKHRLRGLSNRIQILEQEEELQRLFGSAPTLGDREQMETAVEREVNSMEQATAKLEELWKKNKKKSK